MRPALLLLPLSLAGCGWLGRPSPPPQPAHYVLGGAYQAGDTWFYPGASYNADATGLATIQPDGQPGRTADGEAFDQAALAAAHPTLQLPAIARITNLENGRQVVVRINDRGPASPARLVAVTRRTAELLGFAARGVARVRLQVLEPESRAVVAPFQSEAEPLLAMRAAPRDEVRQAALAAPEGVAQSSRGRTASVGPTVAVAAVADAAMPRVPKRLAETVTQTTPSPGALYVALGSFSRREFAERQRARVSALGASIETVRTGRSESYRVRVGPLADVAEADKALAQVIRDGVPDARIVVE